MVKKIGVEPTAQADEEIDLNLPDWPSSDNLSEKEGDSTFSKAEASESSDLGKENSKDLERESIVALLEAFDDFRNKLADLPGEILEDAKLAEEIKRMDNYEILVINSLRNDPERFFSKREKSGVIKPLEKEQRLKKLEMESVRVNQFLENVRNIVSSLRSSSTN